MTTVHAGHSHGVSAEADRGKLTLALALLVAFLLAEVTVAAVADSLALLSDAAHMLTDAAALALSVVALRVAARPARGAMTFGFGRVEILSAQINGVTLLIFAGFIAYEAIRRLFEPPVVRGGLVLATAVAGVLVNLAVIRTLAQANRANLNVEGSFQHILMDVYGFIATGVAAVLILTTGFQRADPIASLVIAALMINSGIRLVGASGRVFLEAAPPGLDPEAIGRALAEQPGVVEVHDLHVWEVSSAFPALSAHVLVGSERDCHAVRRDLEAVLSERFGLQHTTLQVDHAGRPLVGIEPLDPGLAKGAHTGR